jgi:hypothetical protein
VQESVKSDISGKSLQLLAVLVPWVYDKPRSEGGKGCICVEGRMTKPETIANDDRGENSQLAVFSFVTKWIVAGQIVFGTALGSFGGEKPDGLFRSLQNSVEGETQAGRLSVAALGFENKTGNSEAEHWRVALEQLVRRQLGAVKSVRLAPGVEYALRQINKKEGDAIDAAQARKAGEVIEARRVVWGEYKRIGV